MADRPVTIEGLARDQHAEPVADPGELAADIWESDAELEAFLADLRASPNACCLTPLRDVVTETDVASLLQRHQAPPWVLRHLAGARIWLTFVTVGELAKWAVVRKWGQDRRGHLDAWTAGRRSFPMTPRSPGCGVSWREPPSCGGGPAAERHLDRGMLPALPGAAGDLNTADFTDFAARHGLALLAEQM